LFSKILAKYFDELWEKAEAIKAEIIQIKEKQMQKLEQIAALTAEEAKKTLLDNIELRSKAELVERVKKMQMVSSQELELQAKDLLSTVIQRCAANHAAETTTTVVTLPNDEMKGRIIGREGRNIKTIEQLTGVEIVVDDTPEAILISGFSPIRRHLAKRALDKLITDGRIHPVSQVYDECVEIFADMGFSVAEGPDIETDDLNFTKLNIPPEHPARQEHDTFYLRPKADGSRLVLRTHTSPVQIRTMLSAKPPIRIIAPGRVYRSDSDQTHTPMFHQIEGLVRGLPKCEEQVDRRYRGLVQGENDE